MRIEGFQILMLFVIFSYATILIISPIILVKPSFQREALDSIFNSALFSSIATLVCLPIASLLAYFTLSSRNYVFFPLVTFSTAIPHTAIGALLLPLFKELGIIDTGIAIIIAMLIVSLPLATATLRTAYSSLGEGLEVFLKPLGIGKFGIFMMYLRGASKALIIASMIAWLRAFSELGAFLLIAFRPLTAGIYVYETFLAYGIAPVIGASLLMAILAILFSYILLLFEKKL